MLAVIEKYKRYFLTGAPGGRGCEPLAENG
jgi:hypothetical protein